ncbi:MAG: tandem-95 repeat protein [Bacteroidetes bacterium]|nr:tandem-95 repeat protein [Bacteroidota bacterium]
MIQKIVKFVLFSFLGVTLITEVSAQKPGAGKGSLTYIKTTADKDATPLRAILEGDKLFLATQSKGAYIYKLVNPDSLREVAHYAEGGLINGGIAKKDNFLFLSDGLNGILSIDVSNDNMTLVQEFKPANDVYDLAIKGDILYAAESKAGLTTYKILPDGKFTLLQNYKSAAKWAWAWRTQIVNDTLFVIDQQEGIKLFNISKPESPVYLTSFKTNGTPKDIIKDGETMIVANGPEGLHTFSLNAAGYSRQVEDIDIKGDAQNVFKSGRYFFMAAGDDGIYILSETSTGRLGIDFKTKEPGEIISMVKRNEDLYVSSDRGLMIYKYNSPPIFEPIKRQVIDENQVLTFSRSGYDPDGSKVIISAEGLPEGADWNIDSTFFKWKPTFEQSGRYRVYYTITEDTDASLYDLDTVFITVNHVNRLPVIAKIENKLIDENKELSFKIEEGTDPDREDEGKLVHFSRNLPEGASFDTKSLKFTWKPTYDQSGEYTAIIGVKDPSGLEATSELKIKVNHVNRPPVLAAVGAKTIDEMKDLIYVVKWSDPDTEDKGKLVMNATGLPEGSVFNNETGDFSWKPTYEQSGTYTVTFKVTDSNSDKLGVLSDEEKVTLTVNHVSRTPFIVAVPEHGTKEDQQLSFNIRVFDLDKEDFGKLKITATDLPKGSSLKDSVFTWTPDYFQAGAYNVTFTVTEPSELNASTKGYIVVENVNRMPVIAKFVTPAQGKEDSPLQIQFAITDPDLEALTLTLGKLPEGAKFDAATQTFSWVPTYEQAGNYEMKLKAVDPLGGSAEADLSLVIANVNRFPVFAALADQAVNEDQSLTFKVSATDPDRQKVVLSSSTLPEGATFDPLNGQLTWKPTFEQSGSYPVTFSAVDEENAKTDKLVTIVVSNVNRLPVLTAVQPITVNEVDPVNVQFKATDPDRQTVNYSSTNLPEGAVLNATSGDFSWVPTYEQAGKYTISVSATDPENGKVSTNLVVDVKNVNRVPVFENVKDLSIAEGESFDFTFKTSDPDKQTLVISKLKGTLPKGAVFNEKNGEFSFNPDFTQAGQYGPFELTVSDPEKATTSAKFSLTVTNNNRKPKLTVPGSKSAIGGESVEFAVSATDEDKETLTFSASGLPTGATFDPTSKKFSWIPSETTSGKFTVTISVTDGIDSVSDSVSLTITAKPIPVPQGGQGQ